jgi:acetoin utilization deacetylase AcuC-like enzyme
MTAKNVFPGPSAVTGIVRDHRFLAHTSDEAHWENARRLEHIYAMLDRLDDRWPLAFLQPREASAHELRLVHSEAYIHQIADTADYAHSRVTADTFACAGSYLSATLAAGGVLTAIDAVAAGRLGRAFVLSRPPGHHAEASRAGGFCLFNNAAIGARYARKVLGLAKVLIVDWDVHHGNGLQHIFEQDPTVLYFSIHQYPIFPGTGHYLEVGRGPGEGYTINVPLGKGFGDGDYVALFDRLLKPVAVAFAPDLILVAAGFDSHSQDPLGKMKLSENGFAGLTRTLMDVADACCGGRLVLVLEGGYHPEALAASVRAVIGELCGITHADVRQLAAQASRRRTLPVIDRCVHVLGRFWPVLRFEEAK